MENKGNEISDVLGKIELTIQTISKNEGEIFQQNKEYFLKVMIVTFTVTILQRSFVNYFYFFLRQNSLTLQSQKSYNGKYLFYIEWNIIYFLK